MALDWGHLDAERTFNVLDGTNDTTDPPSVDNNPLLNHGHGTETAAKALGRSIDGATNPFHGVAPDATLVDVRCTDSVVLFFNIDLARAIWHATKVGCEVITMSLGGTPEFCTEIALLNARQRNRIVMAAAGNCVPFVTFPASSESCLAIAASSPGKVPWRNDQGLPGSSFGWKVDVTAPGDKVRVPDSDSSGLWKSSSGTSFSVAEMAGAAALWITYRRHLGKEIRPEQFQQALCDSAVQITDWDKDGFGTGIADLDALLAASTGTITVRRESPTGLPNPVQWLSVLLDCSDDQAAAIVGLIFGRPAAELKDDAVPLLTELARQLTNHPRITIGIREAIRSDSQDRERLTSIFTPIIGEKNLRNRLSNHFSKWPDGVF
jgi:serine protease